MDRTKSGVHAKEFQFILVEIRTEEEKRVVSTGPLLESGSRRISAGGGVPANEPTLAVIQPDQNAEMVAQGQKIGVAVVIHIYRDNARQTLLDADSARPVLTRQGNGNDGRALHAQDGSPVGKTISIEIQAVERSRMANRSCGGGGWGAGKARGGGREHRRPHGQTQGKRQPQ